MGESALRGSCRTALRGWQAPDADQEELRRLYLNHLDDRADGWSRDCPGQHLTASALIMSPERTQVLLTLHRKFGRWLQTGGHIEPGDPGLPDAALREAREESGLSGVRLGPLLLLSRHPVPCGPVRPSYHLDVQYLAIADPAHSPLVSAESDDVRWFDADAAPAVDATVTALIAAARAATLP